jgi:pimeloyl-ACP methyl ester carboxylesterase
MSEIQEKKPQVFTLTSHGSKVKYFIYNPLGSTTIVAVHGFRGNHIGLEYIIKELSSYRVIVPDLPGSGDSSPMANLCHDIAGYASFVETFTNALGLDKPPILLGHSFGSIIAAKVAAQNPHMFSKLILINPITTSPRHGKQAPATKMVEFLYWLGYNLPEQLGLGILRSRTYSRLMSFTLSRTQNRHLRKRVYAHHLSDLQQPHHRAVIAESFHASITRTVLDDAAQIKLPTLIIAGDKDPIVPVSSHKHLQEAMPQAAFIVIPNVGHLVHLETPEIAAKAILEFLG